MAIISQRDAVPKLYTAPGAFQGVLWGGESNQRPGENMIIPEALETRLRIDSLILMNSNDFGLLGSCTIKTYPNRRGSKTPSGKIVVDSRNKTFILTGVIEGAFRIGALADS